MVCGLLVLSSLLWTACGRRNSAPPPVASAPSAVKYVEPRKPKPPAKMKPSPIVDSNLSDEDALGNNDFPADVASKMAVVEVEYYGFDSLLHQGQIVVREDLADSVKSIFKDIAESRFPIHKVVPIVQYDWSDDASVLDDNTSGFNYRTTPGRRRLSNHAYGTAIDVNPYENPYFAASRALPHLYDKSVKGTLTVDGPVVRAFRKHGWMWGGLWRSGRDYQHFEYKLGRQKP